MGRSPCCDKVGLKRGPWTSTEDRRLIMHIQKYGEGNWRALPKQAGLLRCGKSCRLRWFNYLRPDIKKGNISKEEENIIIKLHALLGNRWSLIASKLPGRTDNEIKNHWNAHLKKRLIKMGIDPNTHYPLNNFYSIEVNAKKEATYAFQESNANKAHGTRQKYLGPFLQEEIVDNERLKMMEKSNKIKLFSNDVNSICLPHKYDIKCSTKHSSIIEKDVNIIHPKSDPNTIDHDLRTYGNIDTLDGSYSHKAFMCNDRATHPNQDTPFQLILNYVLQDDICTWSETQGDFHWDQLDLIHSLQASTFITSRSPSCTTENNIDCISLWNEENVH